MAKDPAFLFYPNDYLGGTMGMTFEEKGAYMDLLMLQFNRGHMTYRMIGQTVGQLWDKLQDKFVVDKDGLYYNQRLEAEIKKRQSFVESRKNNKAGVNQHTKNKRSHDLAMTSHMENENDNRNIISLEEDIRDRGVRGERESDLGKVMTLYMDKICATPSPISVDLLKAYTADMGAEVVCLAIYAAMDANALSWDYIKKVLQNWTSKGVKSVEDVKRIEAERERNKGAQRGGSKEASSTATESAKRWNLPT